MFIHVSWESFNGYMHSHPLFVQCQITLLVQLLIMNGSDCVQDKEASSLRINDNGSMITSYALLYIDVLWTQALGAKTYTSAGIFSH